MRCKLASTPIRTRFRSAHAQGPHTHAEANTQQHARVHTHKHTRTHARTHAYKRTSVNNLAQKRFSQSRDGPNGAPEFHLANECVSQVYCIGICRRSRSQVNPLENDTLPAMALARAGLSRVSPESDRVTAPNHVLAHCHCAYTNVSKPARRPLRTTCSSAMPRRCVYCSNLYVNLCANTNTKFTCDTVQLSIEYFPVYMPSAFEARNPALYTAGPKRDVPTLDVCCLKIAVRVTSSRFTASLWIAVRERSL